MEYMPTPHQSMEYVPPQYPSMEYVPPSYPPMEYTPPSYPSVVQGQFQGYKGYFDGAHPAPDVVQLPMTSSNCIVEQLPLSSVVLMEQNSNSVVVPSTSSSIRRQETDINDLAKNLASINNAIRDLQEKLQAHKTQFGDLTETTRYSTSEPHAPDVSSSKYKSHNSSNSYKPTPINELEKLSDHKNGKNKKRSVDDEPDELGSMVDDLIGTKPEKVSKRKSSSDSSSDKSKKKRKSVTTFDLFGDESKEVVLDKNKKKEKTSVVVKKKIETSSSAAKLPKKHLVEVSLFPEESLPKKPKVEVSVVKSSAELTKQQTQIVSEPKKRLAHASSSTDTTQKLRQLGGEKSRSQTNFLTPREQLQMRFAQMQKQKEQLLKKSTSTASSGEV